MSKGPARATVSPDQAVVMLHGASREIYGFTPFPLTALPEAAGIYALAAPAGAEAGTTLYWRVLFVGEAAAIGSEAGRGMVAAAKRQGATHLLAHICGRDADYRRFIRDDIVAVFAPPMNAVRRKAA